MRNTRLKKAASQRRRRTREERMEVVGRYVESGQTQRVFAREEGIGVSTLQLWLRKADAGGEGGPASARRAETISLLEVELAGPKCRKSPVSRGDGVGYEVELVGGTRLRLGSGFVAAEVRILLALLKEVE